MDDPTPSSPSFDVLPPDRLSEEPGTYRVNAPEGPLQAFSGVNGMETAEEGSKGQEGGVALDLALSLSRVQIREACKLAFISGAATLAELAIRYSISYDTVRYWSSLESWAGEKDKVSAQVAASTTRKLAEMLSKEQEEQVHRALKRGLKLQKRMDDVLDNGDVVVDGEGNERRISLGAKALQAIAMAEDRADLIIRRNLGMEESNGQAGKISVNVLSGNVQIASL